MLFLVRVRPILAATPPARIKRDLKRSRGGPGSCATYGNDLARKLVYNSRFVRARLLRQAAFAAPVYSHRRRIHAACLVLRFFPFITARLSSARSPWRSSLSARRSAMRPPPTPAAAAAPKAESQAPKHAAHGAVKGKHAERQERIAVPSGPLPATVMAALARAHVPLSSMSVVVQRIGAPRAARRDQRGPADDARLDDEARHHLLRPVAARPRLSLEDDRLRRRRSRCQGVLHGNLYIQGTGDPKLVPEELIDLVRPDPPGNGITGIDGALVLDKRYFDPSTRDLPAFDDDDSAPYNVGPDPLLYAFKSLSFTLTPNPDGQVSIDVLPQLAQLQIDNELHVTRGACAAIAAGGVAERRADDRRLRAGVVHRRLSAALRLAHDQRRGARSFRLLRRRLSRAVEANRRHVQRRDPRRRDAVGRAARRHAPQARARRTSFATSTSSATT